VTGPTWTARLTGLVALIALATACSVSTDTQKGANDLPPAEERDEGDPEVQSTGPTLPESPGNLLTDPGAAQAAIDDITAELGAVNVRSLDVYDHYAIFEVQDPTIPENLDTYTYRDGELEDPDPIHVTNRDLEELPQRVFLLSEVRWDLVAGLSQTAVTQLGIEDGIVNHMGVDRTYDTFELRLSLSVSGPRRSGSLEATADGTVLEAQLF
jgi:hypothetical protein